MYYLRFFIDSGQSERPIPLQKAINLRIASLDGDAHAPILQERDVIDGQPLMLKRYWKKRELEYNFLSSW